MSVSKYATVFIDHARAVASAVVGKPIPVRPMHGDGLAATDGKVIFFGSYELNDAFNTNLPFRTILANSVPWWGALFHEVGHILFSPRTNHEPYKSLVSDGQHATWNILEDQRMERLVIGKYPSVERYFLRTVADLVLAGAPRARLGSDIDALRTHVLISGRTYLPVEIRAKAFAACEASLGSAITARVQEICIAYLGVTHPKDNALALALIVELQAIIDSVEPLGPYRWSFDDHGSHKGTKPETNPTEQRKISKEFAKAHDETPVESDDEVESADAEGEHDAVPGDVDDGEPTEATGSGDGDADDADDADGEVGGGKGGSGASGDDSPTLEDILNDIVDESTKSAIANTPKVDTLIEKFRNAEFDKIMDDAEERHAEAVRNSTYRVGRYSHGDEFIDTPSEWRIASSTITDIMRQHAADQEPQWNSRIRSGRLDMNRVIVDRMTPTPPRLDVFEKWSAGRDVTGIDVYLSLDLSGSMVDQGKDLSHAIHAIHTACWELGVRLTAIGWGTDRDFRFLVRPGEEPPHKCRQIFAEGSTSPSFTTSYLEACLRNSPLSQQLLLTLTDGMWDHKSTQGDIVYKELSKDLPGLQSRLLFLSDECEVDADGYIMREVYRDGEVEMVRDMPVTDHSFIQHAVFPLGFDFYKGHDISNSANPSWRNLIPFHGHDSGLLIFSPKDIVSTFQESLTILAAEAA